ncbi:hypothetical protein HY484_04735 [Candidatus Woesearchaeota archaeon]|nr:hypothetical protein [Candidatus Woesearchaeota archaeon]
MDVNKASGLVFFVVTVLGAVSLMVILGYDDSLSGNVAVYQQAKSAWGLTSANSNCNIPYSAIDLIELASERKNIPYSADNCAVLAQDSCIVLNSGGCLQECLRVVRSADGPCGSSGAFGITGNVVLTPEECKRLVLSYDVSNVNFLRTVGASTQSTSVVNPCSGVNSPVAVKVYSGDVPLQVFTRHVFPEGDISGYVIDSSQPALEYVLCKDGRARVTKEGKSVCSSL